MIYLKIINQIDTNKLLRKIQELISKHKITESSLLKIEIIEVSYDDNSSIPKLEYNND